MGQQINDQLKSGEDQRRELERRIEELTRRLQSLAKRVVALEAAQRVSEKRCRCRERWPLTSNHQDSPYISYISLASGFSLHKLESAFLSTRQLHARAKKL
jgi:hypothetical protein